MPDTLTLHGYSYSVYTRVVRIVMHEKGLSSSYEEVDPFATRPDPALLPFGRVPALSHGHVTLYETAAICRYLDAAFDGPSLTPSQPLAQARMAQVISIVDNYAHWPMVRQVFSHRVFRPMQGDAANEAEIASGLAAASPVLTALDAIAAEAIVLSGDAITLADAHLAPMVDYFIRAPEGAAALAPHRHLSAWWNATLGRASMIATDPSLP